MKTVARQYKGQAGFSLIELMVVVAIIGILATIAIPNFQKFQAKARQSEVKSNLTAIYTAEKAFFAEWNSYRADFRDIGFSPEGRLRYHVGFAAAGVTPPAPFNPATSGGAAAGAAFNTTVAAARGSATLTAGMPAFAQAAAAGTCVAGLTPTATAFTATGLTNPATLGSSSTVNDVWTMTHTKVLCNNSPGI